MVPEPEEAPIPAADDLVIDIPADHVIDFVENEKDALQDLRRDWWSKEAT